MARIDDLRLDDQTPAPRSGRGRRRAVAIGALAVLVAILLALAWRATGGRGDPAPLGAAADRVPDTTAPQGVATSDAAPVAGGFTAGGYVEIVPPGPIAVTARVEGWVSTIEVVEGARVEAGQVLATLDDAVHRQALAEAGAEVALARAHLDRLRAGFRAEEIAASLALRQRAASRVEYARAEVDRQEQLVAIGAAPQRQLLSVRAELAAAEAELAGAQAEADLRQAGQRPEDIAVAEAELVRAETRERRLAWRLAQCVVRAPAAGVVLERFVRVGDRIAAAEDGARAGALMTLFDPARLQVWVEVNQRDADRVTVGQPVGLRADAWRDRTVAGRVVRIMPSANLQRNTVEVKIAFADSTIGGATGGTPWLRPEMSVQVSFLAPDPSRPHEPSPQGDRTP